MHNPNWAWILAGPVAGRDEELEAIDVLEVLIVVVEVLVVVLVELVDELVVVDGWCEAAIVRP